jgi:hypothetical protein
MDRSLPHTLKILEASGIEAGASARGRRVHVWIDGPAGTSASFTEKDGSRAADWLVEHAVRLYPCSDIAKVHAVFQAALAAVARGEP